MFHTFTRVIFLISLILTPIFQRSKLRHRRLEDLLQLTQRSRNPRPSNLVPNHPQVVSIPLCLLLAQLLAPEVFHVICAPVKRVYFAALQTHSQPFTFKPDLLIMCCPYPLSFLYSVWLLSVRYVTLPAFKPRH